MASRGEDSWQSEAGSALQIGELDAALDTVDEEVQPGIRLQETSDDEGCVSIDFLANLDR
jgi:hypothetical protein